MTHRIRSMQSVTRRGFSLIEMLIVVAIILVLLSIILVALSRASRQGQKVNTQFLMTSINQALVTFEKDMGYLPPVLGDPAAGAPNDLRSLFSPPDPTAPTYAAAIQDWYSITSLAEYLIGYGNDQQDAHDGLGIRAPGTDGVWGATFLGAADGSLGARNQGSGPASAGKVYGPYLELSQDIIAGVDHNGGVYFPGDATPAGVQFSDLPKTIVDYWGTPIRYYRRAYPPGALNQGYRARPGESVPSLSDVILLRPTILPDMDVLVDPTLADANGDRQATLQLNAAPFALFSAGPDRSLTADQRFDMPNQFNQDNIVETGQ